MINTGIAGSLDARIDIGDLVISTDAASRHGCGNFGYALGQIHGWTRWHSPADEAHPETAAGMRKVNGHPHLDRTGGVVATRFISDKPPKTRIISNFGGFCTEMEGAAIAQAAYLNKIPFVILRAISDKADDSATMDYPAFEKKPSSTACGWCWA